MIADQSVEGLRLRRCFDPKRNTLFTVCASCDRGQRYCSTAAGGERGNDNWWLLGVDTKPPLQAGKITPGDSNPIGNANANPA
jgi:hypothetical protein